MKRYVGKLEVYVEMGVMWALQEDGKVGYDGLVIIDNGDYLVIYNADGTRAFSGVIDKDTKAGYTPYPDKSGYGQPTALGYRIHWTQRGWNPDEWAALFLGYDIKAKKKFAAPLNAKLVRQEKP